MNHSMSFCYVLFQLFLLPVSEIWFWSCGHQHFVLTAILYLNFGYPMFSQFFFLVIFWNSKYTGQLYSTL